MNTKLNDKSLSAAREALRLELQQNRGLLAQKLNMQDEFPRSLAMQFFTQKTASNTLPIIQWSQTGFKIYKMVTQGVFLLGLLKRNQSK